MIGLAPYGEPKYADVILDNLLDIKEDGTFIARCVTMTNSQFGRLVGGPPREPESRVTQREMDIACSNTPAAGKSADAYTIAARARAGPIVARRNVSRVARLDALVERIGVARAAMLGIVHNEG